MNYIDIKTSLEKKLKIKEKSLELNKQSTHYEIRNTIPRCEKEIEELRLTIQAIDKQIPKKIIFNDDGYAYHYPCPSCGRLYWEKEFIGDYCESCGQKLEVQNERD